MKGRKGQLAKSRRKWRMLRLSLKKQGVRRERDSPDSTGYKLGSQEHGNTTSSKNDVN